MRLSCSFLLAVMAALCAVLSAAAQSSSRPPRPYQPVAITRPAALDDVTFALFRAALAVAVKTRHYAELAPFVLERGFFWGRDFSQRFDPRKPAVDNLAAAIALEHGSGTGWQALAAFAAEATVEPLESRPGVICAPASPTYDVIDFARLLDTTVTSDIDWAYPRVDETPVRGAPEPDAANVGTLGPHFVRLLGFEGGESEPAPSRTQWARLALPDGKQGFVAPGSLRSLTTERLCYIKDLVAGWRIAGYIAGGN
jgi:hypothetical protein